MARRIILLLAVVGCVLIQSTNAWWLPPSLGWPRLLGWASLATFSNVPRCFGDLGCFERFPPSPDFALPNFPGLYPWPPDVIDVRFYIYSCDHRFRPYIVNWNATDEVLAKSPYNPKLRTIFVVHGFRDLYDEMDWMGDMKDFILKDQSRVLANHSGCQHNVIAVDWRNGSQIVFYPQAVANTMMVGANIARLIKQFIRIYHNTENDFAVAGHSLGAHISGFVGKQFPKNKLHNIIGLDPAGPMFTDAQNSHRLNPNDAQLVLTIHTNGGLNVGDNFGTLIPLGHYSFFPNGGSAQPGCEKTQAISKVLLEGFATGVGDTIACAHRRATRLVQFDAALLTDAESVAYECVNYDNYTAGLCGECQTSETCKPFGHWFTWWQTQQPPTNWTKPISLYVATSAMIPWAVFEYQVIIETGNFAPVKGNFTLKPIGARRDGDSFKITPKSLTIEPNSKYTHLIKVPKDIGKVIRAYISLQEEAKANNTKTNVIISSVKFNFLSNENQQERLDRSSTLGANGTTNSLGPDQTLVFAEKVEQTAPV